MTLLALSHVSKSYAPPAGGEAVSVLRDITFTLAEGEAVAIVGPSGSGKSTLLHLIAGLDQPTSGLIQFDDRDVGGCSEKEWSALRSRSIGLIFQQHHLLPQCTVLENVLVPTLADPSHLQTEETTARARQLLEQVGLTHRLDHRPGQLSGGECQRVAVVRALINRPRLLLADEPTGSLDRTHALELGRLLFELNRTERVALVLVTHAPELAALAPRRLTLIDGRLE